MAFGKANVSGTSKGHGEEHQRRGGAQHPETKDEPGGGPGGGQAQSGARWGDSWEGAIGFVGKEVSGWRAGPRPGVEAEVRGQLRPIGWEGGSELLKIRSISFQVQGEGDFHSVNIMSQPTCLLFLFATPHSTWDLSSPNRERVRALSSGREEPSPLDYQGNPGPGRADMYSSSLGSCLHMARVPAREPRASSRRRGLRRGTGMPPPF